MLYLKSGKLFRLNFFRNVLNVDIVFNAVAISQDVHEFIGLILFQG